jgi:hypothetical protein
MDKYLFYIEISDQLGKTEVALLIIILFNASIP